MFEKLSEILSSWLGKPVALLLAIGYLGWVYWLGKLDVKDAVLVISILTWLQMFPLQATSIRESKAVQLKLDELIRAMQGARNELIGADHKSGKEINGLRKDLEEEP